jgi:kumamolisin
MTKMNTKLFSVVGTFVLALSSATAAQAGAPHHSAKAPAIDLGSSHRFENNPQLTVTIALKPSDADEMQALLKSIYSPGSPNYRRFLSPEEFGAKFGPAQQTIDRVTRHLQAAGLNVERASVAHLRVSGSMAAVEREFGVSLHTFEVSATADAAGYRFRAPAGAVQLSPAIAGEVDAVLGLDSRPRYHPMLRRSKLQHALRPATAAPNTPDPPGDWTVADLAQYYDVTPLYKHGISGAGRTIGIVTLAAFTPSDAFAYWASLGLQVDAHRIKIVNIDGGPGAPSDASGSDETTLDVEQSGGLAPGAKIVVYQAPNTDQGFLDAFARAIHDNNADAISTSWGLWEEFLVQGTAISDPQAAGELRAYDNLFIQAAIQGQSLSAAAGDSGSYDMDGEISPVNDVLSVDHPASDPFILAAGGTTLPGEQQFLLNDGSTFTVNVAQERAWSWDYLNGLCAALGFDPVSCGIFPAGGGGGVSVVFPVPFYQDGLDGIRLSEPKQVLFDLSQTPPQKLLTLPARFAGRNLPDISLNADPDTGYTIFYTSDVSGFAIFDFFGGTSFVAPQLAGITTLLDQDVGGRVGLLNFALYGLALRGEAYSGNHSPLRDIRKGDNEFYNAGPGYDQARGLGVLDVANLAEQLR